MPTLNQTAQEESQPSEDKWAYRQVEQLNRGLNVSLKSTLIDESECLVADNIRFEKGQALVDLGYKTFGVAVRGSPRATFQFFKKNGSSTLALITNLTFYVWNESFLEWQYPSNGTKTTMNTAEAAGGTTLDVVSIAGFSDGDFISIELNSGGQLRLV